jgi:hypothetical protein
MSMVTQYVVVENAGCDGECTVARLGTRWAAEQWMHRQYSQTEIEMLHVDVAMEEGPRDRRRRTYDPSGF